MTLRACWLSLALFATEAVAQTTSTAPCTRRLAQTLGLPWRTAVETVKAADPKSFVRTWLKSPATVQLMASFINSRFNAQPATNGYEDATFSAARYVLTNELPWKTLFVGRLHIDGTNGQVRDDPNARALGYFGSGDWLFRYKGNEPQGVMLSASYRILQNVIGLKLVPAPNNASGDATATGRQRAECRGCHYDSPYALDVVARLMPRRRGLGGGATIEFVPVTPQTLFGHTLDGPEALVQVLVDSDAFTFRTCRLAFEFVYGRPETACEGATFDRCVSAFRTSGQFQDAVATLLEDPAFCAATTEAP